MFKQMALKDGEDTGGDDRGDVLDEAALAATAEEEKLAKELKEKEAKDAAAKLEAEKKDGDEEEEEDSDKEKKKDTRIPIGRHKELLEAERAERARVEAKLAQYEHGEDIGKVNAEIDKAEKEQAKLEGEYATLLTDGKKDEAAKVMGEIRKLDRFINKQTTAIQSAAAEARAYERARYDVTVERIEAAYPEMNPDDKENHDPALVRKVLRVMKAYQVDGMPPGPALQEAVKDLIGEPANKKQESAVEVKPKVDAAAAKKAEREEAARLKAADAAGKTPPSTKNAGVDSDKLGGTLSAENVMKMSYSEFSKLDDKALSRMRGDEPE